MSKRMLQMYATGEQIYQFVIGYMINPSLQVNKVFRKKVQKCLNYEFHEETMVPIRDFMKNKNKCVIALIIIIY